MALGQQLTMQKEWSPPILEAERMRGIEAEDVYTAAQINSWKGFFTAQMHAETKPLKSKQGIKK